MQKNIPASAFKTILERTCCRSFIPHTHIPRKTILQLIQAAEAAPTAKNRQPYMLFVITNESMKKELAEAANVGRTRQFNHLSKEALKKMEHGTTGSNDTTLIDAPVAILVCRNSDITYQEALKESERLNIKEEESVANAAYSIQLAAHSLGLASGWLCSPLYIPKEIQTIFERHGIIWNPNWKPRVVIPIGYPKQTLIKTKRMKTFDQIAQIID